MKIPAFIKDNLLLKITSLNSLGILIRTIFAFVSQKIVASYLGPGGVAILGNFRSIIPMIQSFSTLGFFNGVVKYIGEYKDNTQELHKLFSTVTVGVAIASTISFCVLYFGASQLNHMLFPVGVDYSFAFKIAAFSVPFIVMHRIFNAVINGLSAYKKFVKIELISYISSAVLMIIMVLYSNLSGALFAIAITPIIQFTLLFYMCYDTLSEYIKFKKLRFYTPYKNQLIAFTVMSFVTTFLGGFVEIKLRTHLIHQINDVEAGFWTGITNLSKQYFMFTSAIFTLYVIPRFAAITTSKGFKKEVWSIYKTLGPIFALGLLLVFVLKKWVVLIALSEEFLGMLPLFKWQLLGDFIKILSLILAHQFLAKRMVWQFITTELISIAAFYIFASYFAQTMGAEGVVLAHFLRYVLYFIVVLILLKKHLFGNQEI